MIPLLLLTCWLGARGLNADAIWNDEYFSIYDSGGSIYGPRSPLEIWQGVSARNPWHVPGFFLMLSGWGALVGWQPPLLRAMSLLLGLLAVAWTYRLGRDFVAPGAGLFAAAILGSSAFFIHYLHEIRMYSLFVMLVAFAIWCYLTIVAAKQPRWWHWLGLLIGSTGLLYTHYYASLTLVMLGAYHLFLLRTDISRRRWLTVVGILILAGALFIPWSGTLIMALTEASGSAQLHERALNPVEVLERLAFLFGNGSAVALLIVLTLAIVGSSMVVRTGQRGIVKIWIVLLLLLILFLVANVFLRIMHEGRVRYLIMLWVPISLAIGSGLFSLYIQLRPPLRWIVPLLLVGWIVYGSLTVFSPAFSANLDGTNYDFPLNRVAATLRDEVQAEDVVLSYLPDESPIWVAEMNQRITEFYFSGVPVVSSTMRMPNTPDLRANSLEYTRQSLGERLRVWLAYRLDEERPLMLGDLLETMADDGYRLCRNIREDDVIHIDLYTRESICCAMYGVTEPALLQYGESIHLTGVELLSPREDGMQPVVMTWAQDSTVPPYVYSVAVHLWDADGNIVAQADYGLEIPATTCQQTLLPTGDLEPGDYTLRVAVYDWQTGGRLPGVVVESGEQGDMLPLTTITIE